MTMFGLNSASYCTHSAAMAASCIKIIIPLFVLFIYETRNKKSEGEGDLPYELLYKDNVSSLGQYIVSLCPRSVLEWPMIDNQRLTKMKIDYLPNRNKSTIQQAIIFELKNSEATRRVK